MGDDKKEEAPAKESKGPIVMKFAYEYKEAMKEEVDTLLTKMIEYYKSKDEFGKALSNFKLTATNKGYEAVEFFADAAAYEVHAANTLACPFLPELLEIGGKIVEKEGCIYGLADEVAASPAIGQFYPNTKRVDQIPDLSKWGEPHFGWSKKKEEEGKKEEGKKEEGK